MPAAAVSRCLQTAPTVGGRIVVAPATAWQNGLQSTVPRCRASPRSQPLRGQHHAQGRVALGRMPILIPRGWPAGRHGTLSRKGASIPSTSNGAETNAKVALKGPARPTVLRSWRSVAWWCPTGHRRTKPRTGLCDSLVAERKSRRAPPACRPQQARDQRRPQLPLVDAKQAFAPAFRALRDHWRRLRGARGSRRAGLGGWSTALPVHA